MRKISLRYQRITDAKRFYEILNNPNFKYFYVKPKSIKDEIEWLKKNPERRKTGEYNYSIVYNKKMIGGCGIRMNKQRKYLGEIGYFIDKKYWNKGIVTEAVKILEKIGFYKLGLKKIKILIHIRNKASEKVAKKSGYKKERIIKKFRRNRRLYRETMVYIKAKN